MWKRFEMVIVFFQFLFLGASLVVGDTLDRTYLPPPGSVYSGGSSDDLITPLETPNKSTVLKSEKNIPQQIIGNPPFFTNNKENKYEIPKSSESSGLAEGNIFTVSKNKYKSSNDSPNQSHVNYDLNQNKFQSTDSPFQTTNERNEPNITKPFYSQFGPESFKNSFFKPESYDRNQEPPISDSDENTSFEPGFYKANKKKPSTMFIDEINNTRKPFSSKTNKYNEYPDNFNQPNDKIYNDRSNIFETPKYTNDESITKPSYRPESKTISKTSYPSNYDTNISDQTRNIFENAQQRGKFRPENAFEHQQSKNIPSPNEKLLITTTPLMDEVNNVRNPFTSQTNNYNNYSEEENQPNNTKFTNHFDIFETSKYKNDQSKTAHKPKNKIFSTTPYPSNYDTKISDQTRYSFSNIKQRGEFRPENTPEYQQSKSISSTNEKLFITTTPPSYSFNNILSKPTQTSASQYSQTYQPNYYQNDTDYQTEKSPTRSSFDHRSNNAKRRERPQTAIERTAQIVNYKNILTPDGFEYSFDTSNGIHADENGTSINGVKAEGSFSYTGDDGKFYQIVYSADENGYRPSGDHLPTPPPIPEAIQRVIEQAERNREAGVTHDGFYDDSKYGYRKYDKKHYHNEPNHRESIKIPALETPFENDYDRIDEYFSTQQPDSQSQNNKDYNKYDLNDFTPIDRQNEKPKQHIEFNDDYNPQTRKFYEKSDVHRPKNKNANDEVYESKFPQSYQRSQQNRPSYSNSGNLQSKDTENTHPQSIIKNNKLHQDNPNSNPQTKYDAVNDDGSRFETYNPNLRNNLDVVPKNNQNQYVQRKNQLQPKKDEYNFNDGQNNEQTHRPGPKNITYKQSQSSFKNKPNTSLNQFSPKHKLVAQNIPNLHSNISQDLIRTEETVSRNPFETNLSTGPDLSINPDSTRNPILVTRPSTQNKNQQNGNIQIINKVYSPENQDELKYNPIPSFKNTKKLNDGSKEDSDDKNYNNILKAKQNSYNKINKYDSENQDYDFVEPDNTTNKKYSSTSNLRNNGKEDKNRNLTKSEKLNIEQSGYEYLPPPGRFSYESKHFLPREHNVQNIKPTPHANYDVNRDLETPYTTLRPYTRYSTFSPKSKTTSGFLTKKTPFNQAFIKNNNERTKPLIQNQRNSNFEGNSDSSNSKYPFKQTTKTFFDQKIPNSEITVQTQTQRDDFSGPKYKENSYNNFPKILTNNYPTEIPQTEIPEIIYKPGYSTTTYSPNFRPNYAKTNELNKERPNADAYNQFVPNPQRKSSKINTRTKIVEPQTYFTTESYHRKDPLQYDNTQSTFYQDTTPNYKKTSIIKTEYIPGTAITSTTGTNSIPRKHLPGQNTEVRKEFPGYQTNKIYTTPEEVSDETTIRSPYSNINSQPNQSAQIYRDFSSIRNKHEQGSAKKPISRPTKYPSGISRNQQEDIPNKAKGTLATQAYPSLQEQQNEFDQNIKTTPVGTIYTQYNPETSYDQNQNEFPRKNSYQNLDRSRIPSNRRNNISAISNPSITKQPAPIIRNQDVTRNDPDTPREIVGEDFSGPKQPQRFDPETGYYY